MKIKLIDFGLEKDHYPFRPHENDAGADVALGENLLAARDAAALRRLAGPNVEFLGAVDDRQMAHHFSHCKALLFPGVEDFGIVPLEVSGARTHKAIPGSQLKVIKGAPHGFNLSHADEFNQALLEFLKG